MTYTKSLFLCLSAMFLVSVAVQAEVCRMEECCQEVATCGTSGFYLGPQAYYVQLHVRNSDSSLAGSLGVNKDTHLNGVLYGVNGGYRYEQAWGLYANVEANYGQGKLKNGGSYDRYIHEYDVSGVLGYRFGGSCAEMWSATPYAGVSYLFQNESLSEIGVKYRYHIYRIPVGVRLDFSFCSGWQVGLDVTALPQFDATVKVTEMVGARWNLSKRTDWMVRLPVEYNIDFCQCQNLTLIFTPYWKQNNDGGSLAKSSSGAYLGLPPQKWNAYGASFDVRWDF